MNLGQFLSNAGSAAIGMRTEQEAQRAARENQLKLEELNRQDLKRRALAQQQAVPAATYTEQTYPDFTGGKQMDVLPAPVSESVPVAAAATPKYAQLPAQQEVPVAVPTTELTAVQFQAMTPAQKLHQLQNANDKRLAATVGNVAAAPFAAAADVITAVPRGSAAATEWVANKIGIPRIGKALGIYDKNVTSVRIPRIPSAYDSLMPYMKGQYYKLSESQYLDQLKASDAKRLQSATVKAKAAATAATAKAQSWDTTATKYDTIIQQSAAQYGIDPVVLKRLIGSESSFEADPAGNRNTARGIMQFHVNNIKNGMITLDGALNPSIAIPAGAKLLADELQKANGDYAQALMAYKGAKSKTGIASMTPVVNNILSGLTGAETLQVAQAQPVQQATQVAQAQPTQQSIVIANSGRTATGAAGPSLISSANAAEAPPKGPAATLLAPTGGVSEGKTSAKATDFYMGNPDAIGADRANLDRAYKEQQANVNADYQAVRSSLIRNLNIATQSGLGNEAEGYRNQLMALDSKFRTVSTEMDTSYRAGRLLTDGMNAVIQMEYSNNPTQLSQVLSYYQGKQIDIQPVADGTYQLQIGGKVQGTYSKTQISSMAREFFDKDYRAAKNAAIVKMDDLRTASQFKILEKNADALADMIKQVTIEQTKGNNAQALEWMKANANWDIKPTGGGDGSVIIRPPGAAPYLFNPTPKTIVIDGISVESNAAYPIAGLPTYSGSK
jgi:hypothetical protein